MKDAVINSEAYSLVSPKDLSLDEAENMVYFEAEEAVLWRSRQVVPELMKDDSVMIVLPQDMDVVYKLLIKEAAIRAKNAMMEEDKAMVTALYTLEAVVAITMAAEQ